MSEICVIFDLDGTLVDSEGLCNRTLLELVTDLQDTVENMTRRYRGMKLRTIFEDIENRIGEKLPDQFEQRYRVAVADLFETELEPMPGVHDMLDALPYPCCIASSGPLFKIRQALDVCNLASYFDDRLFSAYEVGVWKPDPGLFLHAAREMGFSPSQCIVVEDSIPGIEAAVAARMTPLLYDAGNHHPDVEQCQTFHHYQQLPELLYQLADAK